ncbi:MAG: hypothetical protein IKU43_10170 [Clostridia bacterium]|nr:hypothetical protein [Clostridia bacterium]
MLTALLALPTILLPYVVIFETLYHDNIPLDMLGILIAVPLICVIINLIYAIKAKKSAKTLLLVNMIVKLIHIPAYVLLAFPIVVGFLSIRMVGLSLIVILFECLVLLQSGLISIPAFVRAKKEDYLPTILAVFGCMASCVFFIDVFVSVAAFIFVKIKDKRTESVAVEK